MTATLFFALFELIVRTCFGERSIVSSSSLERVDVFRFLSIDDVVGTED